MAGRLDGKIAIITGGNSGIGEGTAHRFAEEGAKVVLMARRGEQGADVQNAIRSEGGDATYIRCDVADSKSVVEAVAAAVDTYGSVDILFNNAGFGAGEQFPEESDESWDRVINAYLSGTHRMTKAVWSYLIKSGGGAIVNMSSIAAVIGFKSTCMTSWGARHRPATTRPRRALRRSPVTPPATVGSTRFG